MNHATLYYAATVLVAVFAAAVWALIVALIVTSLVDEVRLRRRRASHPRKSVTPPR